MEGKVRGPMRMWVRCRGWWQRGERGDVPGWVMITVMTILLVSALFAMFNAQVTSFFRAGLDQLTSG
jgi:hypothetical protein